MNASSRPDRCAISADQLSSSFDGEIAESAAALASHIGGCSPCAASIEVLGSQRDALTYLANLSAQSFGETVADRVLSRGAHLGKSHLADLLYELAKVWLVADRELELRVERVVEPRSGSEVSREAATLSKRLNVEVGRVDFGDPKTLRMAQACLSTLENLEGSTARQQLMVVQLHVHHGQLGVAEEILERLLASGMHEYRHLVYRNLTWILNLQGKYAESAAVAEIGTRAHPNDVVLLLNHASAASHSSDRSKFMAIAQRIAIRSRQGVSEHAERLIRLEAPCFAKELNASDTEIAEALGLKPSGI